MKKKIEKKIIFFKKEKKRKKLAKKKKKESTVDYCCNPQYFVCEGTVIPPHDLDIVVIWSIINSLKLSHANSYNEA